ncbi:hypothetical protein CEXT_594701 [Caerostris extrusa]|uniref:Uncharacterized protein n=1 Tax=Caerostris extrusa TaxID=172846 RepID=A0AAV4P2D2_CAEEX|nr:hypothetical protein CEXT_594701 [Caerostris extrusa]
MRGTTEDSSIYQEGSWQLDEEKKGLEGEGPQTHPPPPLHLQKHFSTLELEPGRENAIVIQWPFFFVGP